MTKVKIRVLNENYVDSIMKLQDSVIDGLENKDILRKNTREMFESCVIPPNLTIGVFYKDELVAVTIGVDAVGTPEDLSVGLKQHEVKRPMNYKLTLVSEKVRGLGLQRELIRILERYAASRGYTHICATVSEENSYSLNNMLKCGFERDHEDIKYGGLKRTVMWREIGAPIPSNNEEKSNKLCLYTHDSKIEEFIR